MFAQNGTHVDRGGGQLDPAPVARHGAFDPVGGLGNLLATPVLDLIGQHLEPVGRGHEVLALFGAVEALARPKGHVGQLGEPFAERIRYDLLLSDAPVAGGLFRKPAVDAFEKGRRPIAALADLLANVAQVAADQQPAIGPVVVEPPQHVIDLPAGDAQPEVIAGDRLDRMGLVEDDHVVVGQDAHLVSPQGQVGEEQGVVDDQDLGVLDAPAGLVVEALPIVGTLASHAIAVLAGHLVPDGRQGAEVEIRPRAVVGALGPAGNLAELLELGLAREEAGRALQRVSHPPPAEVIAAPLDQHGGELQRDHAVEERDVLVDQLLLEADRVGGDDHSEWGGVLFPGSRRGQDRRHQIGETLAHPGARLDHQVLRFTDRPAHGLGHGELLGAVFVVLQPGGDTAFRAEDFSGCDHPIEVTR